QPIQSVTQWSPPFLIPAGIHPGITPTVATPSLDAVNAAPRTVFDDLDFTKRWMALEILSVVSQLGNFAAFDMFQSIGEGHIAMGAMVPVCFAIGRDVHELRPVALGRKGLCEASG